LADALAGDFADGGKVGQGGLRYHGDGSRIRGERVEVDGGRGANFPGEVNRLEEVAIAPRALALL